MFWDVVPHNLMYMQVPLILRNLLPRSPNLKIETADPTETLVGLPVYQTTLRHILEDCNLNQMLLLHSAPFMLTFFLILPVYDGYNYNHIIKVCFPYFESCEIKCSSMGGYLAYPSTPSLEDQTSASLAAV
jgi:hypothetical protein